MSGRFPFPIPNGWFAVAWSDDLAPGEVQAAYCFGSHLALYRTESGEARVLDAYCPHLGAHLGHGGSVVGETIRCPFHAWRFDGDGTCVEIPYARKIPPRARTRVWEVIERYGMIFAWHHLEGKPPFYELPELGAFDDPAWTEPKHFDFRVRTAIQEMAENDHDTPHFRYVHGLDSIPEATISYDGLTKTAVSKGERETPFGTFETQLERVNFGLGLTTVSVTGIPEVGLMFLSSVSPIDEENVQVRWNFTVTRNVADVAGPEFIEAMSSGVKQDIPIWENKVYRPRPVLCDGDGAIGELRRWAAMDSNDPFLSLMRGMANRSVAPANRARIGRIAKPQLTGSPSRSR